MPPATIGLIIGVLAAVAFGVIFTTGGAGAALLVPIYALVLGLIGALIGWIVGRLLKATQ